MRSLTVDLHIHSVLSPCGGLDMSPRAIVARAAAVGLQAVAITDHNSAWNAPALAECAAGSGVAALFGVEARSVEEVDVLTIFDTPDAAVEFGAWVYDTLPDVPCDPGLFGDQVMVGADETVLALVDKLLIGGCAYSFEHLCAEALSRGGLVVPAHVDRPVDSVISQLGWLPEDALVDAVEVSRFGDERLLARAHPWLAERQVVRFSDAHRLDDIGRQYTRFHVAEASVTEFRAAIEGRDGRWVEPVRPATKET